MGSECQIHSTIAFSSEVRSGSREENESRQKVGASVLIQSEPERLSGPSSPAKRNGRDPIPPSNGFLSKDTVPGLAVSDQQHDQGDGKWCRRDEVWKVAVDHAVDFGGTAIFSLSSVQVLRTSAVISVQASI